MARGLERLWAVGICGLCTTTLWAHPGHGETDPTSPLHAAEPIHLLPVAALAIVACGMLLLARKLVVKRSSARQR